MMTLLGSIVAAVVNALLGRFFPGHPQVTPEVIAQAQKDRADILQSQKDARNEADKLRAEETEHLRPVAPVVPPIDGHPVAGGVDSVFDHDANQRD